MKYTRKLLALLMTLMLILSVSADVIAAGYENNVTHSADSAKSNSKAIVIIPGILGSSLETTSGTKVWLHLINYGMMALTESGVSVNSIRSANYDNYGANNTYKTLYNSLNKAFGSSFDVIFFDYDFRNTNTTAARKLTTELSGYNEVVLVAHSMGGLVASGFLANSAANRNKTAALITLGTPFVGAAKCIDVMETGEMISVSLLGLDITLFKNTIRDMSKNCYAAYQLLPTSKYYSITGSYPISVNGTNYTNAITMLKNTAWGRMSNGTVKPMFDTAASFHSSLFKNNVHIMNFSDVTSYTLACTGEDTISKVSFNSNYEITALTYSNAGDETVLQKSAGYGTPDYLYSGTTHTGMVSDSTVISRVKSIITAETGVAAANAISSEMSYGHTSCSAEIAPTDVQLNDRGWIENFDNRRINIYADSGSTLMVNGIAATESANSVYDRNGNKIGSVWELGITGRKLYALYNGEYTVVGSMNARIEYMNNGYFEKAVEYSALYRNSAIYIGSFTEQAVACIVDDTIIQPDSIYFAEDLTQANTD